MKESEVGVGVWASVTGRGWRWWLMKMRNWKCLSDWESGAKSVVLQLLFLFRFIPCSGFLILIRLETGERSDHECGWWSLPLMSSCRWWNGNWNIGILIRKEDHPFPVCCKLVLLLLQFRPHTILPFKLKDKEVERIRIHRRGFQRSQSSSVQLHSVGRHLQINLHCASEARLCHGAWWRNGSHSEATWTWGSGRTCPICINIKNP